MPSTHGQDSLPIFHHIEFIFLTEFKPRKSIAYSDPPLYLCLRLGLPQNQVFHNYTIESYGKRRKRPEYWFSIPRDKYV